MFKNFIQTSQNSMMYHDPKNPNQWICCAVDKEIVLEDGAEFRLRINNRFSTCK